MYSLKHQQRKLNLSAYIAGEPSLYPRVGSFSQQINEAHGGADTHGIIFQVYIDKGVTIR